MPYRQVYEPAPKNMNLKVYENLPDDAEEMPSFLMGRRREAHTSFALVARGESMKEYCFCYHCKGWVEGHYNEYPVNTLNPGQLAGRQGTEYYCPRCGDQVDFFGMMS